jgi:hypothetical protein
MRNGRKIPKGKMDRLNFRKSSSPHTGKCKMGQEEVWIPQRFQ